MSHTQAWHFLCSIDTQRTDAMSVQRPTPSMRMASYIGTAAFLGFFVYMAYQKDAALKAKSKQPLTRELQ